MIDAQKEAIGLGLPLWIAFTRWELQDLQMVTIRIFEVKSLNAPSIGVPVWQPLRTGGGMLDLVLAQPLVGTIHVADDERDVLKPAIVTTRIHRDRPAPRGEEFGQLDEFLAEPHPYHPHPQAEHALKLLVDTAGNLDVRDFLERQDTGVKFHRTLRVGNLHPHGFYRFDHRCLRRLRQGTDSPGVTPQDEE